MKKISFTLCFLFIAYLLHADVRPASIFGDHMVLQRDKEVRIWGRADPGEKIRIEFKGQSTAARAGKDGRWQATLQAMPASREPAVMLIRAENTLTFQDVLVGDVWLCSGQSNMEWTLGRLESGEQEAARASYPHLRMFTVDKEMSLVPREQLSGSGWIPADGPQIIDFSAVAYYFGKHMLQETGVPVGLLTTAWGGTNVEAWTSMESLRKYPHIAAIYEGLDKSLDYSRALNRENLEKRLAMINELVHQGPGLEAGWQNPGTSRSGWQAVMLPQEKDNALFREMDGAVWFARHFEIPGPFLGKDLRFNLGKISDHDLVWVNGQLIGETKEAKYWRHYTVPAAHLKPKNNEIVIRVYDYGGDGGFITDPFNLNFHPVGESRGYQLLAGEWLHRVSMVLDKAPELPIDRSIKNGVNQTPSCLFNQMIFPLLPLSFTGAIWYQGESNAGRAHEYASLFPDMIRDWRAHFRVGDFPFLFVQLAGFQRKGTEFSWPELREAQRRALELPNTGMAVAIDIGDPSNIHPENKADVGFRLALPALHLVYGKKQPWSGPVLENAESMGDKMVLRFSQVGEGLETGGKYGYLMGFEISEDGEHFEFAQAAIRNKNTLWLWNEKLKSPRYVRYAWSNYPADANLRNSLGLPASPFRTGNWDWHTAGRLYGQ